MPESSFAPRRLAGVTFPDGVRVSRCRGCSAPISWGRTANGKACPFDFDLVTGQPTRITHWSTCHAREQFRPLRRSTQT